MKGHEHTLTGPQGVTADETAIALGGAPPR